MRLARRPEPFDDPDWIYEIKFDGFRSLAYIEDGQCRLLSRRRHENRSFRNLQLSITQSLLHVKDALLEGEIVCLDQLGRSQFYELMFHPGEPFFYAFDLLWRWRGFARAAAGRAEGPAAEADRAGRSAAISRSPRQEWIRTVCEGLRTRPRGDRGEVEGRPLHRGQQAVELGEDQEAGVLADGRAGGLV
jgi:hypothetical protein